MQDLRNIYFMGLPGQGKCIAVSGEAKRFAEFYFGRKCEAWRQAIYLLCPKGPRDIVNMG